MMGRRRRVRLASMSDVRSVSAGESKFEGRDLILKDMGRIMEEFGMECTTLRP
jgi:hypothetical protein